MSKIFVKFDGNWADEMDIVGFRIFDKKTYADVKVMIDRCEGEEWCCGSNQEMEIYSSDFSIKEITDEEASLFTKLFDYDSEYDDTDDDDDDDWDEDEEFGNFPPIDDPEYWSWGEDEEDEDDTYSITFD